MRKLSAVMVTRQRPVHTRNHSIATSSFIAFIRSLNAYQEMLANGGDIMLLQPDSKFFQYLEIQKRTVIFTATCTDQR